MENKLNSNSTKCFECGKVINIYEEISAIDIKQPKEKWGITYEHEINLCDGCWDNIQSTLFPESKK